MKKRFGQIVLMCTLAVMLLTVGANAANENAAVAASSRSAAYYTETRTLPAYGRTSIGDPRTKVASPAYAYYKEITLNNNSGMACYINVRTGDGSQGTVCGRAVAVAGNVRGKPVYYTSGYGLIGATYRPSAQTDTESTVAASITWTWQP